MFDEKTILALQGRIAEEHKADQAAIRRVLQLLRRTKLAAPARRQQREKKDAIVSGVRSVGAEVGVTNGHNGHDSTESRILAIVDGLEGKFTFSTLLEAVQKEIGEVERKTLSWVIYRNKDKRIKVIQEGRGRRKAIYEKM